MQDEMTARIAEDLGIKDLPQEEQRSLIGQFGEVALKAATLAVLSKLSADKQAEFEKFTVAGNAAGVKEFLDREVPGHEDIAKAAVAEEVKKFKAFQAP